MGSKVLSTKEGTFFPSQFAAVLMRQTTITLSRAFSGKEKGKGGKPVSSSLGSPGGGAKPFEVYGFAGSIGSIVAYVVYIIWAYTPESWLHAVGITYYPSRYWAVAIPTYVIISVALMCILYLGLYFRATHPPQSPYTLYDEYSRPGIDPTVSTNQMDGDEQPVCVKTGILNNIFCLENITCKDV
ncbi:hypothetical protein R1flu_002631 [Riccia fluitans]|uniref:PIG-P domain-containing protein n=1 Tax=Riccia fluitans TaxID=41844 RepID=A0ABD1Y721_9MARC